MKSKRVIKRIGLYLLLSALAFTLAHGFTGQVRAETPKYGGVVKIIYGSSPYSPGWPSLSRRPEIFVIRPCLEGIVGLDDRRIPIPALATGWEYSSDLKTLKLTLRKGVKFHDGAEFNAEAVKVNLEERKIGRTGSVLDTIESIDVVGQYSVRLNLNEFQNSLLERLAYFDGIMISPKAIEKAKTKKGKKWVKKNPIGTGPFKFVKHERDVILEYEKFEGYWQKGKPYLDGIEFHIIKDNETAVIALKAKEAHAMKNVPLRHAGELEKQGYKIDGYPGGKFAMAPDSDNPDSIFADKRIREAVEYALDREAMSNTLSFGYWKPLNHYASEVSDAYMPGFKGRSYNPEKAKQLLKEAGYPNGFKTTIYATSRFPSALDTMVAVQSYLKKVGIDAKLDLVDGGKYGQLQFKGWKNGLLMFGLGVNFHSATDLDRTFRTGARRLPSLGRLPELDKVFKEAQVTPDDEAQKALVQKAVRRMHDTAMLTPLWVWHTIVASDPSLRGMRFGENFGHSYTPADGWFAK